MPQIKIKEFAQELGVQPELLLEQLRAAGVKKALTGDAALTEKDKTQLLDYLRQAHGGKENKQKITLTRRQTTEIKKADATTGKARTIQVEVRKKRVLIKRDAAEPEKVEEQTVKPVIDAAELATREAEAKQHAELASRQAEDAAKKQEKRKKAQVAAETAADQTVAKAVPATALPAPAAAVTAASEPVVEGTIHKPAVPAGDAAGKAKKGVKKPVKQVVWQDPTARKRSIKTRGDASGGLG